MTSATANLGAVRSPRANADARTKRTRAALIGAFNRLLLADGYEAVTPASIAAAAGVARSTFYAHYRGKPDLLRDALSPVLQPLADAVNSTQASTSVEWVLKHFWANRRLARAMMTGKPREILQQRLADMVEHNLRRGRFALAIPLTMTAASIAHGQVAVIDFWLSGRSRCSARNVSSALGATAIASVRALGDVVHPLD